MHLPCSTTRPKPSTARAKQGEKRRQESPPHGVWGSDATTDFAPKHVSSTDFNDSDASPPKQTKLATDTTEVSMGVVDSLVSEVNTEEKTGPAISEKIAKALDSILSVGLNDSVATKRKEAIDRPQNCKLLTTTRINPEIWDIAEKANS